MAGSILFPLLRVNMDIIYLIDSNKVKVFITQDQEWMLLDWYNLLFPLQSSCHSTYQLHCH